MFEGSQIKPTIIWSDQPAWLVAIFHSDLSDSGGPTVTHHIYIYIKTHLIYVYIYIHITYMCLPIAIYTLYLGKLLYFTGR